MLQAEDNAIHEVEYRIEGEKSGNTLWFSARERVYQRDQSGKPEILFGICQDITRRKKNAETLHELEMRWQFALEGAVMVYGIGMFKQAMSSFPVNGNPCWDMPTMKSATLWTSGKDASTQMTCRGYWIRSPDILTVNPPFYKCEHRVLCKDGNYKWILDRGKVIEWTVDHKPLRMIGTHKDISEHKRIEEVLLESTHS